MTEGKDLRIIFMGTPEFAVATLDKLVQNEYNVSAVVTSPDKPAGRGKKIQSSAVKKYAEAKGIPLLQPVKMKDPEFLTQLSALQPDLIVVVAFRMLPEAVWAMPYKGTVNLHASLLPHYRGAAPINHVIINGDKESGVTTFFIEKEIDTGKIIFQEKVVIPETMNAGELHDILMEKGADLMVKTVAAIAKGEYPQVSQQKLIGPDETPRQAPKIFRDDCRINWDRQATEIQNHIRGLSPYPAAWTHLHDENGNESEIKIFESVISNEKVPGKPGTIHTDNKNFLRIAAKDAWIDVRHLQLQGKKKLEIKEFLRGFSFLPEARME